MNLESPAIDIALQLPAPDLQALLQGRLIVTTPKLFLERNREFALYPLRVSQEILPLDQYYRSSFLTLAQIFNQNDTTTVKIEAWATCELCQMIGSFAELKTLSKLTIWTEKRLQILLEEALAKSAYLFVAYLRVYQLTHPLEISRFATEAEGKFAPLSTSLEGLHCFPVLTDIAFTRHRERLENHQPPDYPELEELYGNLTASDHPEKHLLLDDIAQFLRWHHPPSHQIPDPDWHWIKTIADVGNSSQGDAFEKLVRRSFIKLGFGNSNTDPKKSLDPEHTGGAGGLDLYCETPYPVVGECKATQTEKVPDGTPAQLVKLGYKHLQQHYNQCIKIIIAAGELTEDAKLTASGNQMNVIRPETLEKLVTLKAKYPGSIDLRDLKHCLEATPFGEDADRKLLDYIAQVEAEIQLRSHIIKLVKDYQDHTQNEGTVESLSGAYAMSRPPRPLSVDQLYSILVELSSPLTGYVGRIHAQTTEKERFYFLRSLDLDSVFH